MSRRPAEGPLTGEPPAKMDIAAIRAQLAARRAQVEADLAARTGGGASSGSASPAPPPASASAERRPAGPTALPPAATMDSSVAARLEEARRRVEAARNRVANPYLSGSGSMLAPTSSASAPSVSSVTLHPLLMGDAAAPQAGATKQNEKQALRDRYKPMAPKFSTVKANVAAQTAATAAKPTAPVTNPYATAAAGDAAPAKTARPLRKLQFNAQGRYIKQGDALRNEAKMEALRQRIAAQSRKVGLEGEFDTLERALRRQPPPEVEWWDRAILPDAGTYDDIYAAIAHVESSDSLVTHLVQHPIPIPAPSDKKAPARAMMLTKKEAKKMRRQRRMAELEDKRDRQKMGLLPPDPPKVKLANLMKVLTSDAVQDPTKIEAKVKREVEQRRIKHERDNEGRKLTKEERSEKNYQKLVEKERNGLYASVYKIKYLTNGRHKFKVRETAKHDLLSGVCIFHPDFALVVVEGVDKKIKHFRQLMLHRIDWTEEARALGEGDGDNEDGASGSGSDDEGKGGAQDDMADNKCEVIWEGEVPERSFRLFRARQAESDSRAKEWLTPKWEGIWDLAKRYVWAGEDF
ncbi:U4/U5/U6 small nuclear ribonucleoprotein prp3 [Cryptotrichosporon argae]